mmetsp:Transcript_22601/g.52685  ORF Transcript_22601/g.52685 Transcript_22601/m.52685 type:complete len:444 (+) Transcript_22601:92-1423(+)
MAAIPTAAMRVAVIGGGVTGSACAWRLLQAAEACPVAVTVFEMGRGPGGRATTRRSREVPGLQISHGCPVFHVPDRAVASNSSSAEVLLSSLTSAGYIKEWGGSAGLLTASGAVDSPAAASKGEPLSGARRFIGTPTMASIAEGMLGLLKDLTPPSSVETRFGTKVATVKPQSSDSPGTKGWELLDKQDNSLGSYDWVVVTSASMSHPRHKETFGDEAPMAVAARAAGSEPLSAAASRISSLQFAGVHVAMLAWSLGADANVSSNSPEEVVKALEQLPCDILEVADDAVLAKIVRQSMEPPYAAVVLHSTASFAAENAKVFGSHSSAAQYATSSGSSDQEALVADAMQTAFDRLLTDRLGGRSLPKPSWGPVLHRWSTAFPRRGEGADSCSLGEQAALVLPEAGVAFAGDYMQEPLGCVWGALSSGVEAAEGILHHGSTSSPS